MTSKPLVSVGVPVYNGAAYLYECLESILNQTYTNWECFVINNKSTDETPLIAKKFEARDTRFKVIHNEDFVDMTTNFNLSFKYISEKAKYFKVVCADDWIFPEFIEKMVAVMEENPSTGICASYRIDDKIINCDGLNYYERPAFPGKEILKQQLLNKIDVTGSETTVLYRIDTLKKIENFPDIYSHYSYHFDTSLAYEIFNISDLGFVFQVLSYTRRHEQTYTSQFVYRYRTPLNFRENEIFKYKDRIPGLKKEYRLLRNIYGLYLFNVWLKGDKECLKWHMQRIDDDRKFKISEYLKILIGFPFLKIKNKFKRLDNR